jgi:hypothetical protein
MYLVIALPAMDKGIEETSLTGVIVGSPCNISAICLVNFHGCLPWPVLLLVEITFLYLFQHQKHLNCFERMWLTQNNAHK